MITNTENKEEYAKALEQIAQSIRDSNLIPTYAILIMGHTDGSYTARKKLENSLHIGQPVLALEMEKHRLVVEAFNTKD